MILLAIINALLHFGNANQVRGDPKLDFDLPFYIKLLLYLKGEYHELPPQPFRMRILVPLLAGYLSNHLGVNNAFGLINSLLWIITVIIYFYAIKKLHGPSVAAISSILFSFSVPVMVYGAAISTDMLGYLAIASSILYLSVSQKFHLRSSLILGLLICLFLSLGEKLVL